MPSTSTSSCDHANVIEQNARLKKELANLKGKGLVIGTFLMQRPIADPLISQRPHNSKEGLGYVAPKNKKTKKVKPTQEKKTSIVSGVVIRDNTPCSDFAGTNNPHHIRPLG